jgi:hypothetical protein
MKSVRLLFLLLLTCSLASAQDAQLPPARHSIYIYAGGAGFGLGPAYELKLLHGKMLSFSALAAWVPLHNSWEYNYSLSRYSFGLSMLVGKRNLKFEYNVEVDIYSESGTISRIPGQATYSYSELIPVVSAGIRRQAPNGGLFWRANIGFPLSQDYYLGRAPALGLGIGITLPWRRQTLQGPGL